MLGCLPGWVRASAVCSAYQSSPSAAASGVMRPPCCAASAAYTASEPVWPGRFSMVASTAPCASTSCSAARWWVVGRVLSRSEKFMRGF
ncbi:hypothetical protein D9M69_729060 [compost metagenome]